MKTINYELKQRVENKATEFIAKLKELNIKDEHIKIIEELSISMMTANQLGEYALAKHYNKQIRASILMYKN